MYHRHTAYDSWVGALIIRYPKLFESGLRVNKQVQLTDIFPTILDITGIDYDGREQIQGCSLLKDREKDQLAFTVAEHAIWFNVLTRIIDKNKKFDILKYVRRLKTVRTEEYKYIWASDGHHELYNIHLDPAELTNLIESEPEKASEMNALLTEWLNSFEQYRQEDTQ